jgi:hypothetical protein
MHHTACVAAEVARVADCGYLLLQVDGEWGTAVPAAAAIAGHGFNNRMQHQIQLHFVDHQLRLSRVTRLGTTCVCSAAEQPKALPAASSSKALH